MVFLVTQDIDIVIAMSKENIQDNISIEGTVRLCPCAYPVNPDDLANLDKVKDWTKIKISRHSVFIIQKTPIR